MKLLLKKYILVLKKTDLQLGEVCQPDDAALPNKKSKQNKIGKDSKTLSMSQLNNKSKKLQQITQVSIARNKVYMFLTETHVWQIYTIVQLYTPFYHLTKAWQIQHQDPDTPMKPS